MHLLIAIPHYVRPGGTADRGRGYGSLAADPSPRVRALTACLAALHQSFHPSAAVIHHGARLARRTRLANPVTLDVVICTTGGCHVLDQVNLGPDAYTHRATPAEPLALGFECHEVLRAGLGRYDYFGYLEDDLILRDPWFFQKLAWFNRLGGDDKLLQPNRYEGGVNHTVPKLYVDGDLRPEVTAAFQDVSDSPPLTGEMLGAPVAFVRTLNPHAGCFFLSAAQVERWVNSPHFADHDSRFIGPLETAATLGIMRAFRVYRADEANAAFLEIEHYGTAYIDQICKR